ncbi:MAG: CD225/dispanin family protein [Nitrospirae bacterium]|nr:CD225/dispanin family protein [Nitrospirota bacterium]
MIYCSRCGSQNEDNYYKCVKCETLLHQPLGGAGPYRAQDHVPDYLVWSVLSTLFCCLPVGIVAIVYSAQVGTRLRVGDVVGARHSSRKAKMWCWISIASWAGLALIGTVALIGGALSH